MATKARMSKSSEGNTDLDAAVSAAIQNLQRLRINFLAIDFDQTLIDIHTGGVWTGTVDELVPHVRVEFRELIASALQTGTIHVAIVTFSKQPAIIKSVLEGVLGMELASKIVIRGEDRSWSYEGAGSKQGKQAHMASAVEELMTTANSNHASATIGSALQSAATCSSDHALLEITKTTTLLIDDDKRNIQVALDDGVRAVWLCPSKPRHLLRDLKNLI
jgi:hypothetical protein